MLTEKKAPARASAATAVPVGFMPQPKSFSSVAVPATTKKQQRHALAILLMATDIMAVAAAFTTGSLIRLGHLDLSQFLPILSAILPIYLAIALNKQGFGPDSTIDFGFSFRKATFAFCFACGSLLLIAFFLKVSEDFSRIILGLGTAFGLINLAATRYCVARLGKVVLQGQPFACLSIYDQVKIPHGNGSFAVDAQKSGLCPDPADKQSLHRLGEFSAGMDRVVVHCHRADRQRWAFALKSLNIHAEIVIPELARLAPLSLSNHLGATSLLLSSDPLGLSQRLTKRIFDLTVTLMMAPLIIPFLAIIAILIRLESKGPALFRQERIGISNRPFTIWKMRSMRLETADADGDRSTTRNDDRLTHMGRFVRRTSIDELPQLWNVLRGDMSIVGPRPHAAGSRAENLLFWDIDDRYWHRHAVKPGLTGLAQIRGYRGSTMLREDVINRLQADLEYVADWSLISDIRIILQTFGVLSHKNAY